MQTDAYLCTRGVTGKMTPDIRLENYISDNIEEAVRSGWIKAYFQPVIRTLTGQTAGYEALARWIDPVHGFLTPDLFIPVNRTGSL